MFFQSENVPKLFHAGVTVLQSGVKWPQWIGSINLFTTPLMPYSEEKRTPPFYFPHSSWESGWPRDLKGVKTVLLLRFQTIPSQYTMLEIFAVRHLPHSVHASILRLLSKTVCTDYGQKIGCGYACRPLRTGVEIHPFADAAEGRFSGISIASITLLWNCPTNRARCAIKLSRYRFVNR